MPDKFLKLPRSMANRSKHAPAHKKQVTPPIPKIPVEEVDYDGKEKVYSRERNGLAPRAFRHIRKFKEDS